MTYNRITTSGNVLDSLDESDKEVAESAPHTTVGMPQAMDTQKTFL